MALRKPSAKRRAIAIQIIRGMFPAFARLLIIADPSGEPDPASLRANPSTCSHDPRS